MSVVAARKKVYNLLRAAFLKRFGSGGVVFRGRCMMRNCMNWASWSAKWLVIAVGLLIGQQSLSAAHPQATVGTGLHTASDGFSEQFNVGFGFTIPTPMPAPGHSGVVGLTPQGNLAPGISFSLGDATNAPIPFGGGGAALAATTGFGIMSPLGNAFLTLSATQSNTRSLGGQMGSVTVMDGGTGFISDTSQVPFVTSFVPVVGGLAPGGLQQMFTPGAGSPSGSILGERLQRLKAGDMGGVRGGGPAIGNANGVNIVNGANNAATANRPAAQQVAAATATAGQGVASVAEIRAQQAAAEEAASVEFRQALAQAQVALDAGKPNVAKIYFQQVARRANGPLKQQALAALASLDSAGSSRTAKNTAPTNSAADAGSSP